MVRRLALAIAVALVLVLPGVAAPAGADVVGDEWEFLRLVNRDRAAAGLQQLSMTVQVRDLSRRHSAAMAAKDTIWHRSPLDAGMPSTWQAIGENVGLGGDVASLHDAFMASPGHRANVMNGAYNYVGIGVVRAGGTIFVTEIFLKAPAGLAVEAPPAPVIGASPFARLAGGDRVATALEVSRAGWADGTAPLVVVASGEHYAEALPAAVLAGEVDGPLLLSTGGGMAPAVLDELRRLGAVTALTVGSVPSGVADVLRGAGLNVRHVGVPGDAVGTAVAIAREIGGTPRAVALVNRDSFADGISASTLTSGRGWPILLTTRDGAPAETVEVWHALGAPKVFAIGGPAVIADQVVGQFAATRLWGVDRYATSVSVASTLLSLGHTLGDVFAATGTSFPDALAAGPLAARRQGVTLLIDGTGNQADGASRMWLRARRAAVERVNILGGPVAVTPLADAHLQAALAA